MFFSLSQEGLFHLLDSIEGQLHAERIPVYSNASVDGRQLRRIIRYTIAVFFSTLTIASLAVDIKCRVYSFIGRAAVCTDEENILSFCQGPSL